MKQYKQERRKVRSAPSASEQIARGMALPLVFGAMFVWGMICCSGAMKSLHPNSNGHAPPSSIVQTPASLDASQKFFVETLLPIIQWQAVHYPVPYGRARLKAVADGFTSGAILPAVSTGGACGKVSTIACVTPVGGRVMMEFNVSYFQEQLAHLDWESFMDEVVLTTVHEELHIELGHFEEGDYWASTRHENEVQWRTAQNLIEAATLYGRFAQKSPTTAYMITSYYRSGGNDRSAYWEAYIDSVSRR